MDSAATHNATFTTHSQQEAFVEERAAHSNVKSEVLAGLMAHHKSISPKFFYDEYGSQLFEQIMRLPEYYPTRSELSIFEQYASNIQASLGQGKVIIEPGAGNLEKIRYLLDSLKPAAYVPTDISADFLFSAANDLKQAFPWLSIHAIAADIKASLDLPKAINELPRVLFFPGSTIGNYTPEQALEFLKIAHQQVGENGELLIGVDLIKDTTVLHKAYNDARGVTALFNLNVLNHISRIIGCNINTALFEHKALYNKTDSRVEMYLVSKANQHYTTESGEVINFTEGEEIHTEFSCKYSIESFKALAAQAGFELVDYWLDDNAYFSVQHLRRII